MEAPSFKGIGVLAAFGIVGITATAAGLIVGVVWLCRHVVIH